MPTPLNHTKPASSHDTTTIPAPLSSLSPPSTWQPPRPRSSSVGNVGSVGSAPAVPPPCPDEYECPLTLCLMDDPVTVTVSGITYEREAIMQVGGHGH